jgi:transketolase
MVRRALKAADDLRGRGIQATVLDMHTLKPLDEQAILRSARRTGVVVTIEEHSAYGGLGGAVAEVLAEHAPGVRLKRLGLPDRFCPEYGTQDYLLDRAGLSVDAIASAAREIVEGKQA